MARIAGSSPYYEIGCIDATGALKGKSLRLPSVTTILKALPKGGLDWWGHKIGVRGVLALFKDGELSSYVTDPMKGGATRGLEEAVELVYEKLKADKVHTPAATLGAAGIRGTDIHDLAEKLFTEGTLPPKADIEQAHLGYAEALWKFYKEKAEGCEVLAQEIPVFSLVHKYAGTLDLLLRNPTTKTYYLVDFKTSKAIYESHLLQVTAYEYAARELGWIGDGNVISCVVRLGPDGNYDVKNSTFDIDKFLIVKQLWEFLEETKGGASWFNKTKVTS